MIKAATYLLGAIFIVVSIMWLTDGSNSGSADIVREGESLKLLYELSDAELAEVILGMQAEAPGVGNTEESEELPIEELPEEILVAESVPESEPQLELEPEPEPQPEPELEPVCYSIGEVRDPEIAAALGAQLEKSGYDVFRMSRVVEELGPYMVHTDSHPTAEAALEVVEDLLSDGIESIIIRDDPYENGVSLGVFQSEENSARLVAYARELGYDVNRRQLPEEVELFSFLLSSAQTDVIEDSFWAEVRTEFDGVQVEEKSCEEVASASNFQ